MLCGPLFSFKNTNKWGFIHSVIIGQVFFERLTEPSTVSDTPASQEVDTEKAVLVTAKHPVRDMQAGRRSSCNKGTRLHRVVGTVISDCAANRLAHDQHSTDKQGPPASHGRGRGKGQPKPEEKGRRGL